MFTRIIKLLGYDSSRGRASVTRFDPQTYRPAGRAVTRSSRGGLRFKSRAGKIGHCVAYDSPPLQYFFGWNCVARHNDAEMGPANSLHVLA